MEGALEMQIIIVRANQTGGNHYRCSVYDRRPGLLSSAPLSEFYVPQLWYSKIKSESCIQI